MWDTFGYGFSAILVVNEVSIVDILVINRVWLLYSSLELGMFLIGHYFILINKTINDSPSQYLEHWSELRSTK